MTAFVLSVIATLIGLMIAEAITRWIDRNFLDRDDRD